MPIWVLQIMQIATWPVAVVIVAWVIRSAILGWARSRSNDEIARRHRAYVEAVHRHLASGEERQRLSAQLSAHFDPDREAVRIANAVPEIPPVAREKMKPRLQEFLRESMDRIAQLATTTVVAALQEDEHDPE